MPTLSFVTFDGGYFKGNFTVHNRPYTDHLRVARMALSPCTLVQVRPDDEVAINLRAAIDTDSALGAVDDQLNGTPISLPSIRDAHHVARRGKPQPVNPM